MDKFHHQMHGTILLNGNRVPFVGGPTANPLWYALDCLSPAPAMGFEFVSYLCGGATELDQEPGYENPTYIRLDPSAPPKWIWFNHKPRSVKTNDIEYAQKMEAQPWIKCIEYVDSPQPV